MKLKQEMDNKTLGGIIVSIAVTAFFMSIALALSLGVAILFTCLFKSESKK